ncbi:agmatine deiminase family protein [Flavilitoribacter nigricans]|uniref:Agmatine deiminase n=1 Tax=Flavilitoribacter nigricans (strain ATCC 23147 / DSM 23189 / NBRC 102662 / NCIMB 1420 / SS-2) TaxID=1122177 RepID=A0A2D0NK31_FLAN2|nr:agmatine deiminase family protein [Flavilitoribacter nigricans]PHN08569.1 agmatine deiminase [Flavilitoribacter nigricans DSM 23189 = NBRC 102662]
MSNPYRLPAEWEPQCAVQLTFPHADSDWAPYLEAVIPCFVEIITAISRYESVLVICDDIDRVAAYLGGLPKDRLVLVDLPSNDTWARDHGGITVLQPGGNPLIWDFVFNGWGLKFPAYLDNLLTSGLQEQGILGDTAVQAGGIVLEGGGIETDGQGTLMTTTACMLSPNRNPHLDHAATEAVLRDRFGCDRILWLEHGHLDGDDTDSHIDTLARFCDPDTIAYVQCDDPEDVHYTDFQAMEQELQAFRKADGTPYRLIPLPWPEACYAEDGHRLPATYANFLIINEAVLAPIYQVPQDEAALQQLAFCFPEHEIIGINCRALIEQHGSLHCVTMQYPAAVGIGR